MEAFHPHLVGREREIVFGDTTLQGEAIQAELKALNLDASEQNVKKMIDEIRKLIPEKKYINLEEFDQIAKKLFA